MKAMLYAALGLCVITSQVSALTKSEEEKLIKECNKVNNKIKKIKKKERESRSAKAANKLRIKRYSLDQQYTELKCITVRSKLKR